MSEESTTRMDILEESILLSLPEEGMEASLVSELPYLSEEQREMTPRAVRNLILRDRVEAVMIIRRRR